MRFPRTVAAHRIQTWLLVTAMVAVAVTALLVIDLARSLRSTVISETTRSMTNAATELIHAGKTWQTRPGSTLDSKDLADQQLKAISYDILRSYLDVEGGYLLNEEVLGHSFPPYTEPGSVLRQPPFEHELVLSALAESRDTGSVVTRVAQDQNDLVVAGVLAVPNSPLAAWTLRRIFNFSSTSELYKRLLLVCAMLLALIATGAALRLSFGLQRGFRNIKAGLEELETDLNHRLAEQNPDLHPVVEAINRMAARRQKMEAALRREDRLRIMGRVVAGIAHEIRNPLNSIRLTTRVLARTLRGHDECGEPIELITAEIDRLDALLRSFLVFRAEEPPKTRVQALQPILERTVALVSPHSREHGVEVRIHNPQECSAAVDGDFLQQAVINLLLNAVDASGPQGEVSVSVIPVNSKVEILVQDSGPGLTVEQQERIFEAFYTTKPGGTGLGLAVTKTLLEKMGATIEYANGGRGARFRVVLPAGETV
ncbi:MAG: HAMP domain-containing histidine kinase [Acidobacteria bacterium]|nr:HAMP domain-containing histidine kinase [Acidobacteriota bacterium]